MPEPTFQLESGRGVKLDQTFVIGRDPDLQTMQVHGPERDAGDHPQRLQEETVGEKLRFPDYQEYLCGSVLEIYVGQLGHACRDVQVQILHDEWTDGPLSDLFLS